MAVVGLDIHSRKPLADGASFGSVGTYERIDGIVRFAVDPAHPANPAIVDLDKAARDARRPGPLPGRLLHPPAGRPARRATAACCSTC